MASWPLTLPQTPRRDVTRTPRSNVVGFDTEVGEGKRRRRTTYRTQRWTLSFVMTNAQVAIFETWFQTDLGDGALRFDWTHPLTGVTWSMLFAVEQAYTISHFGAIHQLVQLNLEGRVA